MKKLLALCMTLVLCLSATIVQAAETPPEGYVSLYSLTYVSIGQTDQTGTVDATKSKQLVGPASGWGSGTNYYSISKYSKLAFKLTFDAADAGKQVALRIAFNKTNSPTVFLITYPTDGSTSMIYEVDLAGKTSLDGMVFYNGATHTSFTYTAAAAKAVTINYVALKTVPATALSISPADAVVAQALPYGISTTLNAVFTPTNATYNTVNWESLDTDIATVDANGVVKAGTTKAGTVTIKATSVTYPTLTATYDVKVVAVSTPVTGIQVDSSSINLKMLNTKALTYSVLPSNATDKTVTWTSSDPTIATVDANGLVTPVAGGSATITAKTTDGNFTDACVVNVAGFKTVPAGYSSLYTLQYNDLGTLKALSETTNGLGAVVPALFSSNGNSLLGPGADWNKNNRYVDLKTYSNLDVACSFKPEDIGKTFEFRYAFSTAAGSNITNRTVTITSTDMLLSINLDTDAGDLEDLKYLGALKFRSTASGNLTFNVDYVAVKTSVPTALTIVANNEQRAKALAFDSTVVLHANITPSSAVDKSVTWSSLNPEIATVSETGVVKANATTTGTATIKAVSVAEPTVFGTFDVHVVVPVDTVALADSSLTLRQGQTKTLAYKITPVGATNKSVTWSSSDVNVATVSNGDVTAVAPGTAKIKITSVENSSLVDSCIVNVIIVPTAVSIIPKSGETITTLHSDSTLALKVVTTPENASKNVTWKSLNTALATITSDGVMKAGVTSGLAQIEATCADTLLRDTFEVTIFVPVASFNITSDYAAVEIGATKTLANTVLPAGATNKAITWSSSNESIATVSNGVVTAVALGKCYIKGTSVENPLLTDSCEVYVTPVAPTVSLYSLTYVSIGQTDQTGAVEAGKSKQLVGQASGWNSGANYYDISKYSKLAIKLTFAAADAGKQVALRVAFSKSTVVTPFIITYPNDGSTSMVYEIDLTGKTSIDGMYFYNGASHFSFSYTGTAATNAANIDYIQLKTVTALGLGISPADAVVAQSLPYNISTKLNAVFKPTNATYNEVTWESSDTEIATVDATGLVKAGTTKAGSVAIKATSVTYPDLTATYTVNVVSVSTPVTGVQIDSSSIALKMLNTRSLTYSVLPAIATDKSVTWTSSDPNIATVDANGLVTPVSGGTVTITVKTTDGSFTDECIVNVAGFLPIPEGYVSLYTLNYNESGTEMALSSNLSTLGAVVPAIFSSNGGSLLGTGSDWNRSNKYVDLTQYTDLQVACSFKPEDLGKTFEFRYAFSKASGDAAAGSDITNRTVTITSTNMLLNIDLTSDAGDTEDLRHLGAVKFRSTASGNLSFNVDYIAVKTIVTGIKDVTLDANSIVDVYSITGSVVRKAVKYSEATTGLKKGIYIVGNKKVAVTK